VTIEPLTIAVGVALGIGSGWYAFAPMFRAMGERAKSLDLKEEPEPEVVKTGRKIYVSDQAEKRAKGATE